LGKYTISDKVIIQIINNIGTEVDGVDKIIKTRVTEIGKGIKVDVDVCIELGKQIVDVSEEVQKSIKTNLEKMTHLNVHTVNVYVKMLIKK